MNVSNRFLNYVKINTTSSFSSGITPSTAGQLKLAELLIDELKEIGIQNVTLTDKGYIYAKLKASKGYENATPIGFIAHMDTAPAFSGESIAPIVHTKYDGTDILLPKNNIKVCSKDFRFMSKLKGKTLITADGSTLLGADDKAGIAEIITMCQELIDNNIPHGTICIGFTPDEEIGAGADFFDVEAFGAKYAYTMDGDAAGCIEYENFNAAGAQIQIQGVSVHPGSAKDVLVNSLLIACEIQGNLPAKQAPEHTEGYEGFFFLESLTGDSTTAKMSYIIRDHDEAKFNDKKQLLNEIVTQAQKAHPTAQITIQLTDSYYNMKAQIQPCMHLVDNAKIAAQAAGLEPRVKAIRGGTDGARLSFMGLPCPNLGTGGQNFHGPYEIIAIEDMQAVVEMMLHLVKIYSK